MQFAFPARETAGPRRGESGRLFVLLAAELLVEPAAQFGRSAGRPPGEKLAAGADRSPRCSWAISGRRMSARAGSSARSSQAVNRSAAVT